ncbi:MAG: hypothetical protein HC892_00040 [Saprospiraceae bacterium]|nr:hypothetical protein [Saprospiraceae bacterium]
MEMTTEQRLVLYWNWLRNGDQVTGISVAVASVVAEILLGKYEDDRTTYAEAAVKFLELLFTEEDWGQFSVNAIATMLECNTVLEVYNIMNENLGQSKKDVAD